MTRRIPYSSRQEAAQTYRMVMEMARRHSAGEHSPLIATMAELGRRDLYFLLVHLLGRKDLEHDWIFARCKELAESPDGHLDLWAREHCKSSLITFGLTIQDILRDPETTICIFSHTRPMAKGFLKQIKREFETNKLLLTCYPDVLYSEPHKQAPQWSEDGGLVVRRKSNPKEATLEAWGLVDGQPTGKHFSLLVYDDVVTRESVTSPEQIAKVTEAWALSLNLGARRGVRRYIGTRYHINDTYREILARGAASPRIYPATADGTVEGDPVLLSPELLAEKRREMGPYVFGCQMLQNPAADKTQGFKEAWLRYWTPKSLDHLNRYILVDPAGAKKKNSDYTVMLVVGLGPDGFYYLVDGLRDRLNLTERAAALFRLHRKYQPVSVGYEKYGLQADIEHIQYQQEQLNYRFSIVTLGGNIPKNDRIRALIPPFEQGRVYLPARCPFRDSEGVTRDLVREFVNDEYMAFPVAAHDDMLDCLARILDPALGADFPASRELAGLFAEDGENVPPMAHMDWSPFN